MSRKICVEQSNQYVYTYLYMYVGIDIGGTKTLAAVLDDNGVILERIKFPTPKDYIEFLHELATALAGFEHHEFQAGGLAMPVTVFDRDNGVGISYGNLPWENVPIHSDVEKIVGCPLAVENDAKLGALSEAMLLKDQYRRVLYVTVSTGIGTALVVDGKIDANFGDAGGKSLMFEHHGHVVPWESFASGHAIVDRYKKRAEDIHDDETWQKIVRDLSLGLVELIATLQPEVIVIGGSVGTYFNRYGLLLEAELKRYDMPLIPMPAIVGAQRAEEAVVYGCYDYAKQEFANE
jgi:predicted NBD/HSP70 family sugar kinase